LRSMLSSDLEINHAFKMLLRNSGRVKYDDEVVASKLGRYLTELLQSSQGNIFMQLSLLLNEHKHHKRMNDLMLRYMSEMSIKSVVDHLNLEVNSLISVIGGGQPYGAEISLSGERYLGDSERLYAGFAQNIMDGQTEIKQDTLTIYQNSSKAILGQLKAIERMVADLVSNLNTSGSRITERIIETIDHQIRELQNKASVLIPGLHGLGFVVVQRLNKLTELVSRVKFLYANGATSTQRSDSLSKMSPTSAYQLTKESYNELVYQLRSAKQSFAQVSTSGDGFNRSNIDKSKRDALIERATIESKSSGSSKKKKWVVEGEGKDTADELQHHVHEAELKIHDLRTQLKSSVYKRLDDTKDSSFSFKGFSASDGLSEVKLLSIKRNIERSLEILIGLKGKSTSLFDSSSPWSPKRSKKNEKGLVEMEMDKLFSSQQKSLKNLLASSEIKLEGMSVAVIGGDWVGCHLASVLAERGVRVTLYEPKGQVLMRVDGPSSWIPKLTQGSYAYSRLDSGARYPSNPEIREQCAKGSKDFLEKYGTMVKTSECLYAIGKEDCDGHPSRTDADFYEKVIEQLDPNCREENPESLGIEGVTRIWRSEEKLIPIDNPGSHFLTKFQGNDNVSLSTAVQNLSHSAGTPSINGEKFDWVLNCTNFQQHTHGMLGKYITYHPYIKLLYSEKKRRVKPLHLNILDGNFCSFEPLLSSNPGELQLFDGLHMHSFNKGIPLYAFTHKKHSRCGGLACRSLDIAKVHLNKYNGYRVKEELRPMFEQDILRFYPKFLDEFEFVGYSSAIITHVASRDVFRGCVIKPKGTKLLHVFAPRLTEIFDAEQSVLKLLLEHRPSESSNMDILLDSVRNYTVQPFGFASRITQSQFERVFLASGIRNRRQRKDQSTYSSRSPRAGAGVSDFRTEQKSITMPSVHVGSKVLLEKDRYGVVRYVGPVEFADGEWFGIELLKSMGAHDGQVKKNGKRYFYCAENRGIFVQQDQIRKVFDQERQRSVSFRRFKGLKDPEMIRQAKSLRNWSIEDVCRWAAEKGMLKLISKLKYNSIDGKRLLYATQEQLLSILRINDTATLNLFKREHSALINRGGEGLQL